MDIGYWMFHIFFRILNYAPFLILAMIPFRDTYRVSRPKAAVLIILLTMIDGSVGIWCRITQLLSAGTFICMLLYVFFYLLIVKAAPEKILFTLFIILNYAALTVTISLCLLIHTMGRKYVNSIYNALYFLLVLLITYPVMGSYLNNKIRPLVISQSPGTKKAWKSLWLVPAIFYGIYYYSFYADWMNSRSFIEFASKIGNTFFVIFLNIGFFCINNVIQNFLNESELNLKLSLENQQLSFLARHTENLQSKIEETKKLRHDLHHHLSMIDHFLMEEDYDGLKIYLKEYRSSLPDSSGLSFCENKIVNAIIDYYWELAKRSDIKFTVSLSVPQKLPILESDFCGLFSNILENALEACNRMTKKERFITIALTVKNSHTILLLVENSYEGVIKPSGRYFLSAKKNRVGIGLKSVSSFVEKYNGIIKYEYEKNIFRTKIFLPAPSP